MVKQGPDLPEDDPGKASEGGYYLDFLKLLKQKLPGKSVSIAAPASYWYLRQFPLKKISEVVDYIVYMTYDLHGQWDHGNKWSTPGCPIGNCLRSHVNKTETLNTLVRRTRCPWSKTPCNESSLLTVPTVPHCVEHDYKSRCPLKQDYRWRQ